jgi:pyridinium-3,5-biscarboxylic acid mononucleotide sulfurtransferase
LPMNKLKELRSILRGIDACVVAFSGGADSSFLTKTVSEILGSGALAATVVTPFFSEEERREAGDFVAKEGIRHVFLAARLPGKIGTNPPDRCYHCKTSIFSRLLKLAGKRRVVIEASTIDDKDTERPGMRALRELGIRSPLREAGMGKVDVRRFSRLMGLSTWDKPSSPCLATRFPFGERLTPEKLAMVAKAEAYLRGNGLRTFRVRYHQGLARIEAGPGEQEALLNAAGEVVRKLRSLGFGYVTLDVEGFRSGSMDRTIGWKNRK